MASGTESPAKRKHRMAMWLMDVAHMLRREDRLDLALQLYEAAENWEREAAGMVTTEPSITILKNSADEIRNLIESYRSPSQSKDASE